LCYPETIKILQLNVWGGKLGKQIVDLLNREKADVACLQEPIEFPGGLSILFEDLDEIKQKTGYQYCFFNPQFGYKFMNREARSGMAILSNLPFIETNAIFTRLEYVSNFDILDMDYNVRSLQHVVVEKEGKRVHILNHHGHHVPDHKNGNEETNRQCKMIVDYIQKLNGSVVLCGDFNLSPNSESLEQINKVLVNHVNHHEILTTRTPLTHKTEVCDYIFTSSDIEVKNFQVLDDIASDHKAITIEF
jgi:endonuclease/exonuclease/phosphatase family metal-dependent hydrolase